MLIKLKLKKNIRLFFSIECCQIIEFSLFILYIHCETLHQAIKRLQHQILNLSLYGASVSLHHLSLTCPVIQWILFCRGCWSLHGYVVGLVFIKKLLNHSKMIKKRSKWVKMDQKVKMTKNETNDFTQIWVWKIKMEGKLGLKIV